MSLTKTLLAGAAVCALSTAPALAAAPNLHLGSAGGIAKMTAHHSKTGMSPNTSNFTTSVTFTGSLSEATFYKTPIQLWGELWYNPSTCIEAPNQKFTTTKKTAAAKISGGTETGTISSCPSTTYTFYGPVYTLKSKTATSDSFTSQLVAKKFSGYNLTLNATTNLTITP